MQGKDFLINVGMDLQGIIMWYIYKDRKDRYTSSDLKLPNPFSLKVKRENILLQIMSYSCLLVPIRGAKKNTINWWD